MNPLKQGLKRAELISLCALLEVFIHESIKTRVETKACLQRFIRRIPSLSMNPLKQGLKLLANDRLM